jgi:hypothetical protein
MPNEWPRCRSSEPFKKAAQAGTVFEFDKATDPNGTHLAGRDLLCFACPALMKLSAGFSAGIPA